MDAVNYAKLIICTSKWNTHAEKRQSSKRNRDEIKQQNIKALNSAIFAANRENFKKKVLKKAKV